MSDAHFRPRRIVVPQVRTLWPALAVASVLTFVLMGGANSQAAELEALPASAADGGFRYVQVIEDDTPFLRAPLSASAVDAMLSQGTLLSNFGCMSRDDTVWCEAVPVGGRAGGFIRSSHIRPAKGVDGNFLKGPDDSKKRARKRDFDVEGRIKCAQIEGESLGECRIQIARAGGGDATAIVTFSNKFTRELSFRLGDFIRANATMSGVGRDIDWGIREDLYILRVDDQRFEIPVSFVLGDG